jgi:hypothetical protein
MAMQTELAPSLSHPQGQPARPSKKLLWTGRVMSTLPVLMLLMSAAMKFARPPDVVEGFQKLGYSEDLAVGLGILELVCTVIYVIPQTAVLGAILLTGYLGGATATHVRVGDPFHMPVLLGLLLWGGLYLRDPRLRALLPWRR